MRKRSFFPAALAAFLSLQAAPLRAGNGTSAVNFLLESRSARVEGMGGLNSVFSEGPDAISGNPAGLAFLDRPEANFSYVSGQALSRQGSSAYAHPLKVGGRLLAFGAELVYYNAGNIDVNAFSGPTRSLSAETGFVGAFSAAFRPLPMLAVGISPKLIRSTLVEQYSATAFAADAGLTAFPLEPWWGERFSVGLSLQNMGSSLKYKSADNDLPSTQSFGFAARPLDHPEFGSLLFGVQAEKPKGEKMRYRLGGEYAYGRDDLRAFFLRGGARMQFDSESYSIGLGFREKNFELDYSFNDAGDLERVHRITIVFRLGKYAPKKKADEFIMDPEKEIRKIEKKELIPEGSQDEKYEIIDEKSERGQDRYYMQDQLEKGERKLPE